MGWGGGGGWGVGVGGGWVGVGVGGSGGGWGWGWGGVGWVGGGGGVRCCGINVTAGNIQIDLTSANQISNYISICRTCWLLLPSNGVNVGDCNPNFSIFRLALDLMPGHLLFPS